MDAIQKLRDIHGILCINATPDHTQKTVSIHISHFSDVVGRIDAMIHHLEKQAHNQAIADAINAGDDEIEPTGLLDTDDKDHYNFICDVMDGKV